MWSNSYCNVNGIFVLKSLVIHGWDNALEALYLPDGFGEHSFRNRSYASLIKGAIHYFILTKKIQEENE